MDKICEIIPSQKENNKINVHEVELQQSILLDGLHYLKNFTEYHHSPQASNVKVAKTVAQIKQKSCEIRDNPTRIIQDITTRMSQEYHPYMPSTIALCARIKHIRRSEMPSQL
ncbi:hypothetical protein RhiirA4_470853 [Rhizophagus irregularis]|uniref:Uncharacterized protein n=1 Tax=Rhizophagus irregularis TaxID=588596 RepID=A0A2I1H221_9GLOM|nr:hypothetical protein RhiirA4_470853 [Rhizophagus irregularis]